MRVLLSFSALLLPNNEGNLPSHWAAQNAQTAALTFLAASYADIDMLSLNRAGRSVVTEAFQSQNSDCIALCLSHSSASEDRLMPGKASKASSSKAAGEEEEELHMKVNIEEEEEEENKMEIKEEKEEEEEGVTHILRLLPKLTSNAIIRLF